MGEINRRGGVMTFAALQAEVERQRQEIERLTQRLDEIVKQQLEKAK